MTTVLMDTVVSPVAESGPRGFRGFPMPESTIAERLGSLDDKTVYLIDTGFGGSYQFMRQLQDWFAKHMPSVKTIRKRKPGGPFSGSAPELWEEVKEKGNAAVLGVAG